MNKLSPEQLYLLLDEPIYVLEEHFEGHEPAPEAESETDLANFKGENKKGILIVTQNSLAVEDEEFLFKGLNALEIFAEDVTIISKPSNAEIPADIVHTKRLFFSANPVEETLYQVDTKEGIANLECHSIDQIRNNKDLKVGFWLGLKAMFSK
jgi:hypothetical protein